MQTEFNETDEIEASIAGCHFASDNNRLSGCPLPEDWFLDMQALIVAGDLSTDQACALLTRRADTTQPIPRLTLPELKLILCSFKARARDPELIDRIKNRLVHYQ